MKGKGLAGSIRRTLISGLLVVGPFSLSFMVLTWFVGAVDGAAAPLLGRWGKDAPGLGLALAVAIVLAAGILANNIVGQHLLEYGEEILLKVPGFNSLYRVIRQITDALGRSQKGSFRRVVLVEYPRPSVFRVGFVTRELELQKNGKGQKLVSVYVPTNHMYIGDYVLLPEDQVIPTPLTPEEGIQCALSAGSSLPDVLQARPRS